MCGEKRALVKNTDGGANEIYQKNAGGGAKTETAARKQIVCRVARRKI